MSNIKYKTDIDKYKIFAIKACKDFKYQNKVMPDCIQRIKAAENTSQISQILKTCADRMFG